MTNLRVGNFLLAVLLGACTGQREAPRLLVPLSGDAALSSTGSPGIATRLNLNGQSAWFVFDTGAAAHTLAQWFVEAAGMPMDSSFGAVEARDATGNPVVLSVVRDQEGELADGSELHLPIAGVANFPIAFKAAGIGGLLNPQLLATATGAVVLDLRVPELRVEPFDQAVRRLGATRVAEDEVRVCASTEVAIPNLLFALLVGTGSRQAWLQLDTGADVTTISSASPLVQDRTLDAGGEVVGIDGYSSREPRPSPVNVSILSANADIGPTILRRSPRLEGL